jgi:hypothetical protein
MTRSELKSLVQNKKIRLTCDDDDELYLVIFPDEWDVSNDVWEQITDILNELNVAMTLRKEMGSLISYPTSNPSVLKLNIRKVHEDAMKFEDWIDHA